MHKTSERCLKALIEGKKYRGPRDRVVDNKWFFYSTPIAVLKASKYLLLNHHGWYTQSTNRRFSEIKHLLDISLPCQWEGDFVVELTQARREAVQ